MSLKTPQLFFENKELSYYDWIPVLHKILDTIRWQGLSHTGIRKAIRETLKPRSYYFFGEVDDVQTSDKYCWFAVFKIFISKEKNFTVFIPWAYDFRKRDGTQSDRAIRIINENVPEEELKEFLSDLFRGIKLWVGHMDNRNLIKPKVKKGKVKKPRE